MRVINVNVVTFGWGLVALETNQGTGGLEVFSPTPDLRAGGRINFYQPVIWSVIPI